MSSNETLLICTEEACQTRIFSEEVRAQLDAQALVDAAIVLPMLADTQMPTIVDRMLSELEKERSKIDREAIKRELFSVNSAENMGLRFRKRVQQCSNSNFYKVNQCWMVLFAEADGIKKRHLAIATLRQATNMGSEMEDIRIVVLVLAPRIEKETKSARETAQTIASLVTRDELRLQILQSENPETIRELLKKEAERLIYKDERRIELENGDVDQSNNNNKARKRKCKCRIGKGLSDDFRRKIRYYLSDYLDGIKDARTISKVTATTVFLVFTILPTSISYGILNENNTNGTVNVQKVILGQAIGGVVFSVFGGQQLLVLSTSAPLSIYISVIYEICKSNDWNFWDMYAAVGIYTQIYLIIYALFQLPHLMKYSMRSTEEIFSLFIATTLTSKAIKAIVDTYSESYRNCSKSNWTDVSLYIKDGCAPASVLLFILLVCGTVWLSLLLDSLRSSVYLLRFLRELLSDYALPMAVLINAAIAYFAFYDVDREKLAVYPGPDMRWIPFYNLPGIAHLPALGLAFPLSLLFFMDQLLVTNTVDNKQHNLSKGSSHNWDLLVVAVLNVFLSLVGLPWMHGALPQSFLHLRSLADIEERLHNGRVQQVIVRARETRLSVLFAHILIFPVYFFLIPSLNKFIPTALFYGILQFMAISSLLGNEFWERIILIFTDQRAYPPTHYLRRVPQRVVHLFTLVELLQLCVLSAIGFSGYPFAELFFPLVIGSFIPMRHFILPRLFKKEYLDAIDGKH